MSSVYISIHTMYTYYVAPERATKACARRLDVFSLTDASLLVSLAGQTSGRESSSRISHIYERLHAKIIL